MAAAGIPLCLSPAGSSVSISPFFEEGEPKVELIDSQKTLKDIIEKYRDYLETRFNTYYKVPGAEFEEENRDRDSTQKKEYVDVLQLLKLSDVKKDDQVCLIVKTDKFVQGILSMKTDQESGELHISALVTAPWNLRLSAPNTSEYPAQKGVGKQLMGAAYRFAQERGLKTISLQPMEQSVGFYEHIGMSKEGESLLFHVEPVSMPTGLA